MTLRKASIRLRFKRTLHIICEYLTHTLGYCGGGFQMSLGTDQRVAQRVQGESSPIDLVAFAKVGLDKTRILSAQVWLSDIQANFAGMNEVWDAWAPEGQALARATVDSRLAAPELLVEIAIVAAAE